MIACTLIFSSICATIVACLCGIVLINKFFIFAIILRFIGGCFEGSAILTRTLVVSISQQIHKRNRRLGLVNFAITCGFLLGPFINGHIYMLSKKISLFFPFFCAALTIIIAFKLLNIEDSFKNKQILANIKEVNLNNINNKEVICKINHRLLFYITLWLTCLSIYFAIDTFYQYVPLFLHVEFSFSAAQIANILLIIALSNGFTNYCSVGR